MVVFFIFIYFHFSEDFGYWSQFPLLIISFLSGHMHPIPILPSFLWLAFPTLTLHSYIPSFSIYSLNTRCSAGTILDIEGITVNKTDGIFSWRLHYGWVARPKQVNKVISSNDKFSEENKVT